jgi:hypothetical protein
MISLHITPPERDEIGFVTAKHINQELEGETRPTISIVTENEEEQEEDELVET